MATTTTAQKGTILQWLFQGWHAYATFGALFLAVAGIPTWRPVILLLLVALVVFQVVNKKAP